LGITDVLFGDYDFTGKLSHTWPVSVSQEPINWGDIPYQPLFEYGYGLSTKGTAVQAIKGSGLSIFPNPVQNEFTIQSEKKGLVEVYDLVGDLKITVTVQENRGKINVSKLSKGLYILKFIPSTRDGQSEVSRFIKD